jgi:regulator of protease activity HflC (stomatin/prohibitin superfamily)
MWVVVVMILIAAVALISFGSAVVVRNNEDKSIAMGVGSVLVVVLALFVLFTSMTTVSARSVGVVTSMGKYQGTLTPGMHFTAPWANVEEFSTQVQYLDLDGNKDHVNVTYKGGGTGAINAVIRWRIDSEDAKALWAKYRTFDKVTEQLVNSSAKDSIAVVAGSYSPDVVRDGTKRREIAEAVKNDLEKTIGNDGVNIDSVSIKGVEVSKDTKDAYDKIAKAEADGKRKLIEQQNAKIDAETDRIRSTKSGSAQDRCLEMTRNWDVKRQGPLPATWSCTGSNSATTVVPVR